MNIKTAMAMAAGRGTRMMPLTQKTCKAMVKVKGRALIDWTLDRFAAEGVEQVIVNVHHFADDLMAHLSHRQDLKIIISDEREHLLETGGGLVKAAEHLGDDPIFVSNIDALWFDGGQSELSQMVTAYDEHRMDVLLGLSPIGQNLGFDGTGDFFLNASGRVERRGENLKAPYAYAGFQILHPRILKGHKREPFSTNRLWDLSLAEGKVFGHPMTAYWMHIGDPKAREEAENRLD